MSDEGKVIALGVLVAGFLGGAAYRGWRRSQARRSARKDIAQVAAFTATTPDGEIARVTGVASAIDDRTLTAPLSGKPCVAHVSRVQGHKGIGRMPLEQVASCPFRVGDVVVESEHLRLAVAAVKLVPSPDQRDRYDAFLAPHDLTRHSFDGGAVFEELVLALGSRVAVVGRVKRDDAVVRLVGDAAKPVIVGDASPRG